MSGTRYPFDWVDAFTDRPFGGNGCSVVHDGGVLSDEVCRSYTKETGLVECTFVAPSDTADVKVRYFLAEREIPFAGHPTIATVISLLDRGLVSGPTLVLETGAGNLTIEISGSKSSPKVTMTQAKPVFGPECSKDLIAEVVGLSPEDLIAPPQVMSTGLPFCITLLKDHDALRRATLDVDALERFRSEIEFSEGTMMEPYLVTLEGATSRGDTFGRLLLAPPNPPEDAFTGSATGATAAYLWSRGLIESPTYIAEQGHWMGKPGEAEVEVLGPADDIQGVRVSGQGAVVMSGEVRL